MEDKSVKITTLDLQDCFVQAWSLYRNNILILSLASIIYLVLFLLSVGIFTGVMNGGLSWMLLKASRSHDQKVHLSDLFSGFNRFFSLTGMFLLQNVFIMVAFFGLFILAFVPQWTFNDARDLIYLLFIISGSITYALFLYTFFLNMDKRMSVWDTLVASAKIVRAKGIGKNVVLFILTTLIPAFVDLIPYSIFLKILFFLPFSSLMLAAAYRQQVDCDKAMQDNLFDMTIR